LLVGQFLSELIWIVAIAYSMRTKVDKTWLFTIMAGRFGSSKSSISGSSSMSFRSQQNSTRSMNDLEVHDH